MLSTTTGSDWETDSCTVHDLTGHSPVQQRPRECHMPRAAQGPGLPPALWCCPLVARGGLALLTSPSVLSGAHPGLGHVVRLPT